MKNNRAGVTLIEILIAVTLLSLLSGGVLIAMRLGLNTMDKTDARLVQNRRVTNAGKIIESEIAGFTATVAVFNPQPEVFQQMPFFQAEPQSMRFVTSYSLADAWRGRPQIAALQVIPGENNRGVRLIVNETPYTGPPQAGSMIASIEPNPAGLPLIHFAPILPGPQSFVLADRLAYCRFSYLEALPIPPFQNWRPNWVQMQKLPLGIRIEMAPLEGGTAMTITVPINVNVTPGARYAD